MTRWTQRMLASAAALALCLAPALSRATQAEDFYKGRQITFIVSTDAGGGIPAYANAFTPHFALHIPNQPRIVVQYMPGAGGVRAMNYLYSVAPKDGTVMGIVNAPSPYAPLFGISGAKYDPIRMNWIGSLDDTGGICAAWSASGIRTWQDVLDKEFIVGSTGAGSQMETFPMMVNKLFGTKIKVISGYKGGNEVFLAMERGEVQGRCGSLVSSITSTRPDWIPQKKVYVPFQVALERNPLFPDSPAIAEFAKDEHTKRVIELVLSHMSMDKPIVLPPGVPAERVEVLRAAFHATMNDAAFIADAKKQRITTKEVSGEKVLQILKKSYAMPPDVVEAAKGAMDVSGG